jgi:hypothetical protein
LSDPEQIYCLPQEADRVNNNTFIQVKEDVKLFDQGSQYIRFANDPPTLFVSNNINFSLEENEGPIATFSATGLSMNSNRITDVANPTSD